MTVADLSFLLPAAQDWEARLQVTYLAPAGPSDPNLPADLQEVPPPRLNIVVSRTPTQQTDPRVECRKFIAQTAKAVPGLEEVGSPGPLNFDDGATGVIATISFPATQQIRLTQLHAFRIDDGILTQLVATASESEAARKHEELRKSLQGFTLK